MECKAALEVGEPCFAKVRGWSPFPARVVGCKNSGKKFRVSVLFYGTKETGDINGENVWPVNSSTIEKFVTKKSLTRKMFKLGWEELKARHVLEAPIIDKATEKDKVGNKCNFEEDLSEGSDKSVEMVSYKNVKDGELDNDEEFDFDFNYNNTREKIRD